MGVTEQALRIRYLGELIKVVDAIKYLGLNFSGNKKSSPNVENLALAAERSRFPVQNRMNRVSPELKIRLGNLLIRPVAFSRVESSSSSSSIGVQELLPIPPTVIRPGLGACNRCDRCL